jgi:hypothetical protein
MNFDPKRVKTLEEGIELIQSVQSDLGLSQDAIFTSIDVERAGGHPALLVTNIPSGFAKTMLPFYTDGAATFYLSSGAPNASVPTHSHDEGAGLRLIVGGSIRYGEQVLREGDWMFMPAGAEYEFDVGPTGVTMFYCYRCTCIQQ